MSINKNLFRKRVLATVVSAASLASYSNAQEPGTLEEVTVVGMRASLQKSMDTKRNSSGVVDAINAEDIGKFPDSNIAESLQRISGLSISRRNGEGSQITVRGIGPDYNMVTLNGRIMPASSLNTNGGGDNAKRAFDMDNIASEAISGLEAYKTTKANIASGGLGATINLKTIRPLDEAGLKMSLGGKLLADQTNRVGDDITPELSGLISWADEEQKFGAALSFSSQERHSAATGAYVTQWSGAFAYDDDGYPTTTDTTSITNEPSLGEVVAVPSDYRYYHADRERTRTNAQLTLQFRPVESVTATLDYTYAEQEIYENRSELSAWFLDFPRTDLVFDDELSPTPVLYWEEAPAGRTPRDIGFALQQQNQVNELNSLGLNVEWQASDKLTLALDYHNSTSDSLPNADYGNWINTGIGANISAQQGADWTGDLPVLMVAFDDSSLNDNGVLDISDVGSAVRQLNRNSSETEISQFRLDGKFEFDNGSSIDFGIESRTMENLGRSAFDQTLLEGGWGISNPGDIPEGYLSPIDYASLFDGYSLTPSNQAWFDDVSDGEAAPLTVGFTGDAAALGELLAGNAGIPFTTSGLDFTTNRLVEEEVFSAYGQYTFDLEVANMPLTIVAGLRYEETDVTSTSNIAIPSVVWQSNNDFAVLSGDASNPENVSGTASYNHLLPNLDIALNITDDIIARVSYGKTMARATYDQLSLGSTINGGPTDATYFDSSQPGTASSGNPGFKPLESENFDLSFEWYFAETSYFTAGYFQKEVTNFPGTGSVAGGVYDIRDPSSPNSPRVQAAVAQLEADNITIDASNLFSMIVAQTVGEDFSSRTATEWEVVAATLPGGGIIGNADDPVLTFTQQIPVNSNSDSISGFEFGVQHFFGDSGFGIQANYTHADSGLKFDVTQDPLSGSQFVLPGLSDTANMTLMYEADKFQGRVSYNWRDSFINQTNVTGSEPEFTDEYSQIDFSLSYEVSDGLFVSFEGINVTEEDQRQYGRSERQLTRLEVLGARYALGVRYSF